MIVTDYRRLRAMERRGFIKCCDGVSQHWSGRRVRNYFVDEGSAGLCPFKYNGETYKVQYIDGCFYPFVVTGAAPAFV